MSGITICAYAIDFKAVDFFLRVAPSQMFEWILSRPQRVITILVLLC